MSKPEAGCRLTESWPDHAPGSMPGCQCTELHLSSFEYQRDNATVNAPFIRHMRQKHRKHYELWAAGKTIGELPDQHAIAHGELTSEEELVKAIEADQRAERLGQ